MIEVRFDADADKRLVLVVEPPPPRVTATDSSEAADGLFAILSRQPDAGVSRSQLR
jgi:hypothetical protein